MHQCRLLIPLRLPFARALGADHVQCRRFLCTITLFCNLAQVGGKVAMDLTMPTMLAWVLGGNVNQLRFQDRVPHCRLPDKPKTFDESVS